jgi:hypothetical protein
VAALVEGRGVALELPRELEEGEDDTLGEWEVETETAPEALELSESVTHKVCSRRRRHSKRWRDILKDTMTSGF